MLGEKMSGEFAESMFNRMALAELNKREIHALSSGERRRLMTYIAISKRPQLLIADEATEIVDRKSRSTIIECVQLCCEAYKTSLLWISHDSDSTAQIANRVLVLKDGKVQPMPERMLRLTIEKDGNAGTPSPIAERVAVHQVRTVIEEDEFQSLHLTIERDVVEENAHDR
jgi:energy-coupling factor transporter ATP-binding protein EcfA2